MQTMLKKHKIDVENKKSTYENNKMEFDGEDFGEKEQIIENSNYKSDNFYENPLMYKIFKIFIEFKFSNCSTKPNTSNLKSNNPPTNSSNPPLLVKKYRPGLTKPQQNN